MSNIDQAVSHVLEGSADPPDRRFTLLFKPREGSDTAKLEAKITHKLKLPPDKVGIDDEKFGGILYLKDLYTKQEIRDFSRSLSGGMGKALPTGSIYVEHWNEATEQFHLIGTIKDFRGYYEML